MKLAQQPVVPNKVPWFPLHHRLPPVACPPSPLNIPHPGPLHDFDAAWPLQTFGSYRQWILRYNLTKGEAEVSWPGELKLFTLIT